MSNKSLIIILVIVIVLSAGTIGGVVVYVNSTKSNNTVVGSNNPTTNQPGGFDTTTIKTSISSAVTNGKLTQRQGELLTAQIENMASMKPDKAPNTTGTNQGTPAAAPQGGQSDMLQKTVDILNEKGLATTLTELQAAQNAATNAGIQMPGGRGPQGGTPPTNN
jgi:hypothetical protein